MPRYRAVQRAAVLHVSQTEQRSLATDGGLYAADLPMMERKPLTPTLILPNSYTCADHLIAALLFSLTVTTNELAKRNFSPLYVSFLQHVTLSCVRVASNRECRRARPASDLAWTCGLRRVYTKFGSVTAQRYGAA